jgi:hypothetical protein
MNDTQRVSVDYRRTLAGFPCGVKGSAHTCACGEPPAFRVVITEPLVSRVGPIPVCAECLPGMNKAFDRLVWDNRHLLCDIRAWS